MEFASWRNHFPPATSRPRRRTSAKLRDSGPSGLLQKFQTRGSVSLLHPLWCVNSALADVRCLPWHSSLALPLRTFRGSRLTPGLPRASGPCPGLCIGPYAHPLAQFCFCDACPGKCPFSCSFCGGDFVVSTDGGVGNHIPLAEASTLILSGNCRGALLQPLRTWASTGCRVTNSRSRSACLTR